MSSNPSVPTKQELLSVLRIVLHKPTLLEMSLRSIMKELSVHFKVDVEELNNYKEMVRRKVELFLERECEKVTSDDMKLSPFYEYP